MYPQALRLTNTAMGQASTGHIVNLMSNDVKRFDKVVLHFGFDGVLQHLGFCKVVQHLGFYKVVLHFGFIG